MDIVTDLDGEYIVSNSLPMFPKCGVYFLVRDNEIVYVGRSVSVIDRLHTHRKDGKNFNRVFFIECTKEELGELEMHYIRKFKPKLNYLPKPPKPPREPWRPTPPITERGRAMWDKLMEERAQRRAEHEAERAARLNFPEGEK